MWKYLLEILFLIVVFTRVLCQRQNLIEQTLQQNDISLSSYVFWPNATVPFYVNPEHFDQEQSLAILSALSRFTFRTCIKFLPVMAPPTSNEHVLYFENQAGVRRCVFDTRGHSVYEPHRVVLGYDCLQSPQIDMVIMRALGFPFEHNRISRDIYLDVLEENIEQGSIDLFTKEASQPLELRAIPYDMNSVMHFGPRDFSKNGHRTILFKDSNVEQDRSGLTKLDLRKIDTVYGPECRARDRQEKLELCQSYPGVARKKRDIGSRIDMSSKRPEIDRKKRDIDHSKDMSSTIPQIIRKEQEDEEIVTKSLRVNPDITPPPNVEKNTLTELGIDEAVQDVVDQVNKVSALALKNARKKYCDKTDSKPILRTADVKENKDVDLLGIIEVIANYAQVIVGNAVANLTKFCKESESIEVYQRARCGWNDGSNRCRESYRSTKSGAVKYSTQHRPIHIYSTNHRLLGHGKNIYEPMFRSGNNTDDVTTESVPSSARRKRETESKVAGEVIDTDKNISFEKKNHNEIKKHVSHKNAQDEGYKEQEIEKPSDEQEKKELIKESSDDKEKQAESNKENDLKVEKGDDEIVLRSGTTVPAFKVNRYEPLRRQNWRNRVEITISGEMDHSSISTETDKPTKKHYIQSEDRENRKWKQRETTRDEQRRTKRMKKNSKQVEGKKYTEERLRESDERRIKDNEYSTEIYKRPKKEQKREGIPRTVKLSKKNEEFYNDRKWPGGVVRYIIREDTTYDINDLRRRIEEVNYILKKKTCVKLKELTHDQAKKYEDYIIIDNSQDYVTGRVGGKQTFGSIELFRGDQHRQHTAMMVMAMLGFYFEVSRHDRDKHVRVHMRHVRPDKLHHFEMIREDATLPLPYDFHSATHPSWQYWRKIGKTGISTVATYKQQDPDGSVMKSMGQNSKLLSDTDIVKINSVYGDKCLKSARSKATETRALASKRKLERNEQNTHVTVAL